MRSLLKLKFFNPRASKTSSKLAMFPFFQYHELGQLPACTISVLRGKAPCPFWENSYDTVRVIRDNSMADLRRFCRRDSRSCNCCTGSSRRCRWAAAVCDWWRRTHTVHTRTDRDRCRLRSCCLCNITQRWLLASRRASRGCIPASGVPEIFRSVSIFKRSNGTRLHNLISKF